MKLTLNLKKRKSNPARARNAILLNRKRREKKEGFIRVFSVVNKPPISYNSS